MVLSIIVPVYNMAADYKLNHCLDSLINQNIDDYEIIAVDDCSTDDSFAIMQEYKEKYPDKFRAIHSSKNLHQGGAKNIGIKEAKGEWIGFIDADDWISPDMYKKLIAKANETGADCVGCDYSLVDHYTFEVGEVSHNSNFDQVGVLDDDKRRNLILETGSLCVKIFKREMILKNKLVFPENIFYEDNALANSFLLLNNHYEYIKEPLYYYYQHDSSTVHTITETRCYDRMKAGRIMIEEAKRHDFYSKYTPEIEYIFARLFYINTLFSYMPGVKHTKLSFVKKLGNEMRQYFPEFEKNKYYLTSVNPEEKKLIHMQQNNTFIFMVYYKILWAYRNIRNKK